MIIAVVGATATGKTALAVQLAKHLNTAVISADSQLVYQGLDIGTAKPTLAEQQGVPHYCMDLVAPNEPFSAAEYKAVAQPVLKQLLSERGAAVIAGGTGFYVRQLLEPHTLPDVPPNPTLRAELVAWGEAQGPGALHEKLKKLDPQRATHLHPNDQARLLRALEIIEATGRPVPTQALPGSQAPILWLGLAAQNRPWLWQRIQQRVDAMLAAGWLDEVEALVTRFGVQTHALQVAHGYPELLQVLQGHKMLDDVREQISIKVRQYSRRQVTWFKRNPRMEWLWVDDASPNVVFNQALEHLHKLRASQG